MTVTIKDIAKIAGVSHTTVSRALREHPAIAPRTIKKIQILANDLGYVPNSAARGLKTNRSNVLGVIVRRVNDPFFNEVLQGIEDVLYAEGYSLFLAASHNNIERENRIIRSMSERRVDGVIICSTLVELSQRQKFEQFQVPTVLINNQANEETDYSIYHNDFGGAKKITNYLIQLGHTDIGYLGNVCAGRTNNQRLQGYKTALKEANLPFLPENVVMAENGRAEGGAVGGQIFIQLQNRPTAIVCFNDMLAIGLMRVLKNAGIHIPNTCSVTGFDNIDLASFVNPSLTSFDQPRYDIGVQSARMLLGLLDSNSIAKDNTSIVILEGELIIRESTAPPPLTA